MRVALLGPVAWRTPPAAYGPWEQVVSLLAERLVDRGVDVTLFATLDSVTTATLDGVIQHPYAEDPNADGRISEALHVAHCIARSGEFDLVHNHLDWLPLALTDAFRAPLVTTVHGFGSDRILPAYSRGAELGAAFVSISDADRSPALSYLATVYHGVDFAELAFTPRPSGDKSSGDKPVGEKPAGFKSSGDKPSGFESSGDKSSANKSPGYLVAFGRIHPDKGTAEAIEIARRARMPLVIAGPVQDERYFRDQVEPLVDQVAVRYLGNVGPGERAAVLGGAVAFLHPIAFEEPFGLSVVEALACGTPVIAYARGSMPELIDSGVTGYLVDGADAAAAAVPDAVALDRREVRRVAESRFSVDRMVDDYLAVYERILRS